MRASSPPLVLLALVVACGRARDDASSVRATDSARSATAPAAVPPAQAAAPVPRADSAGTGAAGSSLAGAAGSDTLCAGVAAAAQRALNIAFTRDSGSAFPSPGGAGPLWSGCRVRGTGTVRPYSAAAAMPEPKLRAAMRGTGWVEDRNFEASGPESSAFALRRGQALCHYDVLFPGTPGEDDDGAIDSVAPPDTNAPPLRYIVRILCTPSAPPRRA